MHWDEADRQRSKKEKAAQILATAVRHIHAHDEDIRILREEVAALRAEVRGTS